MPTCKKCGEPFEARRSDAQYCSSRCTVAAFRARNASAVSPVRHQPVIDRLPSSQIIEGEFREVSKPASVSHDLVPARSSGAPTIHQLRDGGSKRLRRVPNEWLGEPGGGHFDEQVSDGQSDDWFNPPSTLLAENPERGEQKPSKAVTVAPQRPPKPDTMTLFQGFMLAGTRFPMLQSEHSTEAIAERSRLKQENEALQNELQKLKSQPIPQHVGFVEEEPELPDDEEERFELDDEPVHIDDARFARSEQRRQAETGSYGPEPFAVIEHANGRAQIKPMLKPLGLEDLALFNKLERLRRERQAAKNRGAAQDRTSRVAALFTRSRTASSPEAPATHKSAGLADVQRSKSWGERFAAWCTAPPRPPVWK